MIVAGQTVENPQTGERLVFHKTAAETGGEYTEFRLTSRPAGICRRPTSTPARASASRSRRAR